MAKSKKSVTKISDKMVTVNESFSINMYDNGFMFEIGGRDSDNEWVTAKIMCPTVEDLITLVREATDMERND